MVVGCDQKLQISAAISIERVKMEIKETSVAPLNRTMQQKTKATL